MIISSETIIPNSNQLIIQVDKTESVTASGLLVSPTSSDKDYVLATVIKKGPGLINFNSNDGSIIKCDSEVGDVVVVPSRAVKDIPLPNGETISIVSDGEVLCTVRKDSTVDFAPEVPMIRYGAK